MSSNSSKVKNSLNIEPTSIAGTEKGDLRVDASGRLFVHDGSTENQLLITGEGGSDKASRDLSNLTVTGLSAGDLLVGSSATAVASLNPGSDGQILTVVSGSPAWAPNSAADDQTAAEVPFTPFGGIAATNVQTAIQELDSEKQPAGSYATTALNNLTVSGLNNQDLLVASSSSAVASLNVGSEGDVLSVVGGVVAWAAPSGSSVPPTTQTFLSGSGTYTTPALVTYIKIRAVGAGAGGGGSANVNSGAGGGGGAGAYLEKTILSPSPTYSYSVGAGGAAGTNVGTDGSNGGDTTFGTLTAGGGLGGTGAASGDPKRGGSGGTPTNGDLNIIGGSGCWGTVLPSTASGAGGTGGGSLFGTGGTGGSNTSFVAEAGMARGSGGGGGGANAGGQAGADGAPGLITVEEFYG